MSVLKISPNFAQKSEVLYKLGVIFGKTYQLDQAINYLKLSALETNIEPIANRKLDIQCKIGICHLEKKEFEEAHYSFESALKMGEQNARVFQHLAWCEFLMNDFKSGLEHINKALESTPSESDSFYIQARILVALDKFDEAKIAFNNAIGQTKKPIYYSSLAILNSITKNYTEAFDNFLKATQLDPSIQETWYDIGILYEIHHQTSEASVAYQRAIEANPNYSEAITRKKLLETPEIANSAFPQFVHSEFRVNDTMVPTKSYLNNPKVKKASDTFSNPPQDISHIPNPIVKFVINKAK